nr:immunoglobulin light chain junction region [Macaca mulatta]MPO02886.1 immunoglobulin light chain junction region [Macaca mulatta]
CRQGYSAPLTF